MQHLTRSARCVRRSCARTCGVARAKLAAQCQIVRGPFLARYRYDSE